MNIQHLTPEVMRGLTSADVPTADEQDRIEVRLLSLFVTLSFINDLVGPITYIYRLSPSLLYKVASLSHGSWLVGAMFVGALVLALPHAIALLFFPGTLAVRWPRKLATLAAATVLLAWAYLAILSLPLDAGPLFWLYLRQALESCGLAFIYAVSLNSQLVREIAKAVRR